MPVTITRYGGLVPMKPRTRTFGVEELEPEVREALDGLFRSAQKVGVADRVPDGFVYSFEIEEHGSPKKEAEVASPNIPDALRKLLP